MESQSLKTTAARRRCENARTSPRRAVRVSPQNPTARHINGQGQLSKYIPIGITNTCHNISNFVLCEIILQEGCFHPHLNKLFGYNQKNIVKNFSNCNGFINSDIIFPLTIASLFFQNTSRKVKSSFNVHITHLTRNLTFHSGHLYSYKIRKLY